MRKPRYNSLRTTFFRRGFSLLEIVISILILSILSIGTIGYQYLSARMALRANAEITATRTARFILDNWKKTGGDENFDLESLDSKFKQIPKTSQYTATIDRLPMTAEIIWENIEQDSLSMTTIRQIQVKIRWRTDYKEGQLSSSDPTYIMSTYVRRDEDGG